MQTNFNFVHYLPTYVPSINIVICEECAKKFEFLNWILFEIKIVKHKHKLFHMLDWKSARNQSVIHVQILFNLKIKIFFKLWCEPCIKYFKQLIWLKLVAWANHVPFLLVNWKSTWNQRLNWNRTAVTIDQHTL